jgi:hypothetical protein
MRKQPPTPTKNTPQKMILLNGKTNERTPYEAIKPQIPEGAVIVVPGGTASQDTEKSILSPKELAGIASWDRPILYSVNLNSTPGKERLELQRILEKCQLYAQRYGNEDYGFDWKEIQGQAKKPSAFKTLGANNATTYLAKLQPFLEELHGMSPLTVLVGAMPSNQLGTNSNAYRDGWNERVIEAATLLNGADKKAAICFHAYHRTPRIPFDPSLFQATLAKMPGIPALITESGALTWEQIKPAGHKEDTFLEASIATFTAVNAVLRPGLDINGMHPLHHGPAQRPLLDIGFFSYDGTAVSSVGQAFLEAVLPPALTVVGCIDRNGKENPSLLRYVILQRSDGREFAARFMKKQLPMAGDIWTPAMDAACYGEQLKVKP